MVHPLWAAFETVARDRPQAAAVTCRGETWSFRQLLGRATEIAERVSAVDAATPIVGLVAVRSAETIANMLGVLGAGRGFLPLDPDAPAEWSARLLATGNVEWVLDPGRRGRSSLRRAEGRGRGLESSFLPGSPPAYATFSSGTTGAPKGMVVSQSAVLALREALESAVYARVDGMIGRVSLNGPLWFDTSVKQWVQVTNGRELVLPTTEERSSVKAFRRFLAENPIDLLDATPSHARWLMSDRTVAHELPRVILLGGEAVPQDLWEHLSNRKGPVCFNLYGPAECTGDASVARVSGTEVNIGHPLPGVRIRVVRIDGASDALEEADIGASGELAISGWGVIPGYLPPQESSSAFRTVAGQRWFRSGDLGYRRPDGSFGLISRLDDMRKVLGKPVHPAVLEEALRGCENVEGAAATWISNEEDALVAFVVLRSGGSVSQVLEALRLTLPQYLLPAEVIEVEVIPLTDRGKIDHARLLRESAPPRRSNAETDLTMVVRRVLRRELDPGMSFFAQGISSLDLIRLHAALIDAGVEVAVLDLFEASNLQELLSIMGTRP